MLPTGGIFPSANTACTVALCALLLAGWFGWAVYHYDWAGTFTFNTSYAGWPSSPAQDRPGFLSTLWCTLIPHPFRPVDFSFLAESNSLARLRDYFFCIYQVNLPLAFGLAGLLLLLRALRRRPALVSRGAGPASRKFWWMSVVIIVPLRRWSVHAETDPLGLAHICLQPLVALGLSVAAAQLAQASGEESPRWLVPVLCFFWLADLGLGIGLHFYIQAFAGQADWREFARGLNSTARANLGGKLSLGQPFLYDSLPANLPAIGLFLTGLLTLAIVRARGRKKSS